MKKAYFLLGVIGLLLLCAIVLRLTSPEDNWICKDGQWLKHGNPRASMPTTICAGGEANNNQGNLIGGDRDEHGCLGPAGYSWCEVKQKCLRVWEEKCEVGTSTTTPVVNEPQASFSDEALVLSPKQNELVVSPLKVEGQAKGNWFFEATLPVRLFDSENNIIASHFATALDDWMTEKPVRFSSTLVFSTNATSGYLVIAKDNPSGLPQNDGSIRVPVRFK